MCNQGDQIGNGAHRTGSRILAPVCGGSPNTTRDFDGKFLEIVWIDHQVVDQVIARTQREVTIAIVDIWLDRVPDRTNDPWIKLGCAAIERAGECADVFTAARGRLATIVSMNDHRPAIGQRHENN